MCAYLFSGQKQIKTTTKNTTSLLALLMKAVTYCHYVLLFVLELLSLRQPTKSLAFIAHLLTKQEFVNFAIYIMFMSCKSQ